MKDKIGFIAVGQAGGNIGFLLNQKGFDVAFINTSEGDLATINIDGDKKYHIKNGLGCAKDRATAKEVAKNDFNSINQFINKSLGEKELYYLVFSSGGGTGSGISPTFAKIFSQALNKNIGIITILPSEKDTLQAHINSYECLKEITEIEDICSVFILDNKSKNDILHINEKFVNLFIKIFDYKKYETQKGNIDEAEILKLLKTEGMINIATCENDENTDKLIKNIQENIFAPLENDGNIKYLGLSKGIKFDDIIFKKKIGKYLDKFENTNKEYTLAILSGLTLPLKRIKDMKDKISEEKDTIIKLNTSKNIKLEDIDFLNIGKSKPQENIKKEKMTADDILKNFF
ncbi:hypothetical protein [uncultured Tyzzerella sp.]|uniref:hypothetical protein n=1 Tax=uncultured Tyzzerella sp. TaxID=2321398 RepID=UPI00294368C7|nr:hypothetical protein [uncultured Tyzzerella sp.]